jgi:ribosomal protein L13
MAKKKASRVYYRTSPDGVVVEKDGSELAVYRSTDALIETHIKGMLAIDRQDTRKIREGLRSYRPSDAITGRE